MELRQAVLTGDVELVKTLLDQGVDPNYKDPSDQCAALHFAAALGNIDILTNLLQHVTAFPLPPPLLLLLDPLHLSATAAVLVFLVGQHLD